MAPWFCLCCRKLWSAYCRSVIGSAKERKSCGISNILLSNVTNEFLEEFGNQLLLCYVFLEEEFGNQIVLCCGE